MKLIESAAETEEIAKSVPDTGGVFFVPAFSGLVAPHWDQYATTEFSHPVRILTTTIKTDSEKVPLIPVRSEKPIPKEKIMDCMNVIRECKVSAPVNVYDILVENICDTGINIVATGHLDK